MVMISYLKVGEELDKYDDGAFEYVNTNKTAINDTSTKLGMPSFSVAIAGAMAEENDSYNIMIDPVLDLYALSDMGPSDLAVGKRGHP